MGKMTIGPSATQPSRNFQQELVESGRISCDAPQTSEPKIVYITKEVERLVEIPVDRVVEVEKRVTEYIDREVIKCVEVPVEVIKHTTTEVIKEIERIVEKPFEVIRLKFVPKLPKWALGLMSFEALVIIALILTRSK